MTKSIKKIMAVALAVVMLALMIPFSASAEDTVGSSSVTFTVDTQEKADTFKFEIYQLATIGNNGTLTLNAAVTDTAVQNAVKAAGSVSNTNALITACDASTKLGAAVKTWNDSNLSYTETLQNGIYYVKPIATGSFSKANSSIVVVPVEDNKDVALGTKVDTSPISLSKKITGVANGTTEKNTIGGNGEYASAGIGDTVTYTLTANVPGDKVNAPLKDFVILDNMSVGLTYGTVKSIKVDNEDVSNNFTVTPGGRDATVAISLNKADGYVVGDYYGKTVTVEVTATVNSQAVYAQAGSNDNSVSLYYENDMASDTVPGPTVQVFCFKLKLVKVDGAATSTKLQGAEFSLTGNGIEATGKTDVNGSIDFGKQLSAGTYTLTETKAPAGYVLNSTPITVVIGGTYTSDNDADDPTFTAAASTTTADATVAEDTVTITVKNTKITVPVTGGMGTAIFTICGASLIALAGVMFIVLKKKKASK